MLEIERLFLQNYLLIKKLDWNISESPLWIVRGENLDASGYRGHSGNGVGKSLIFNGLATLWLAQPPFSNKKNSIKEIMTENSVYALQGSRNGEPFIIRQKMNKSVSYEIEYKGKLEIRGLDENRKQISRILMLNEDHFYSQVYINSFRPSILQFGRPSQRYDFIEKIFDLSIYDKMNSILLKIASQEKQKRLSLSDLKSRAAEIGDTKVKPIKVRLQELKKSVEKTQNKYKKLSRENEKLAAIVPVLEKVTTDLPLSELKQKLEKLNNDIAELESKIEKYNKNLSSIKEYTKQKALNKELAQKKNALREQMLSLFDRDEWDKISDSLDNNMLEIQTLYKKLKIATENKKLFNFYKFFDHSETIKTAKELPPLKDIENEIAANTNMVNKLSQLLNESKCPVCFQPLSKTEIKSMIQKLQKESLELNDKKDVIKKVEYLKRIEQDFDKDIIMLDLTELKQHIQDLENQRDRQNDFLVKYAQYKEIDIRKLKKPKMSEANIDVLKEKLKQKKKLQWDLGQNYNLLKTIGKNYPPEYKQKMIDRYKEIKSVLARLANTLEPMQEKMHKLVSLYTEKKINLKTKLKLENDIRELQDTVQDNEIISFLLDLYSPKGIRIEHIKLLIQSYINLLNQYASSIFSEKVVFSSEIKGNNFSIYATRGSKTSDVNSLSGAESRQFLALSALVLRMLMPKSLQANIMVLDEIEAGMSEANRSLFCNNFIPLLMEHVAHVILVTPYNQNVLPLPKARELKLKRKNNITTATL